MGEMIMKIEVRKACRTDLYAILDLAFEKKPVFDLALCDRFDEVLAQTGHSVLLCFVGGELCGVMSVAVVDGITDKFPVALFCGGKIKDGCNREEVKKALIQKGEETAKSYGCKRIYC